MTMVTLNHLNGSGDSLEARFPDDFGLMPEISLRRIRLSRWLGRGVLGIAGCAAAFVFAVPNFFPQLLPDARPLRADKPVNEQGLAAQLNRCRFDGVPCVRINGLVAVEANGNNTGPAIQNPVVMRVNGEPHVVSNNVSTDIDGTAHFVDWPSDQNLALCRGVAEPQPQVVTLGNDPNTSRYRDPSTGSYSERLNPFEANCRERVDLDILEQALRLLDQSTIAASH